MSSLIAMILVLQLTLGTAWAANFTYNETNTPIPSGSYTYDAVTLKNSATLSTSSGIATITANSRFDLLSGSVGASVTLAGATTSVPLVKSTSGIVTLNGLSTVSELVGVLGGTLAIGSSERLNNNATLYVDATGGTGSTFNLQANNETVTYALLYNGATLNGSGTLTALQYALKGATVNGNLGTGDLFAIGGTNYLNGTAAATSVAVQSGATLQLGGSNKLADGATLYVNGGTFALQGFSDTVQYALLYNSATLNGSGTLTAEQYALKGATVNGNLGTGDLFAIGGTSTLNGTAAATSVAVQSGATLQLGGSNKLADGATLYVNGGTFALQGFSDTVQYALLYNSATLNGSGTLTAEQYALKGATVNGNLGTGDLFAIGGTSTLNGTSAATLVAVQNGATLQLGASDRLDNNATLHVNGGAFALQGYNDTVQYVLLYNSATLNGTGTLTADQVVLKNGGTVNAAVVGKDAGSTLFSTGSGPNANVLNARATLQNVSVQGGSTLRMGASNLLYNSATLQETAVFADGLSSQFDLNGTAQTVGSLFLYNSATLGTTVAGGTLTADQVVLKNGGTVNAA
ncbi:MAG: hypothetical protein FIB02_02295, partial [Desulfuromonas sp.]|nr:hypothetical protein [Desulfuromonas sp.]